MHKIPYYPISQFYLSRFGEKVHKIPVSVVDDCPNRMGLKGMETCVFCDEWGSAAYPHTREKTLTEQVFENRKIIGKRFKAKKNLIYFQAYTNTFTRLGLLREMVEEALSIDGVVGLVFGTRPDCLSKGVLDYWKELNERTFVAVELGVQSFEETHLLYMKRGHTAEKSVEAIHRIKTESGVDLGIHLMFGWPGETDDEVLRAARMCSSLPVDNVKLHNVHVLKNTELEKYYRNGEFEPVSLEKYAEWVSLFLRNLRADIAIHRLGAVASRWDELVAPDWASFKMRTTQFIIDYMNDRGAEQGMDFDSTPAHGLKPFHVENP